MYRNNPDEQVRDILRRIAAGQYEAFYQLEREFVRRGLIERPMEPRGRFEEDQRNNYPRRGRGLVIYFDNPQYEQLARELQARFATMLDYCFQINMGDVDEYNNGDAFRAIARDIEQLEQGFYSDVRTLAAGLFTGRCPSPCLMHGDASQRDEVLSCLGHISNNLSTLEAHLREWCRGNYMTIMDEPRPNPQAKYLYHGICNDLRRSDVNGEQKWQDMMAFKRPISVKSFLRHCDISRLLDEGESFAQFMEAHPDIAFYSSYWGEEKCYFIQTRGFEFIFLTK